MMKKINLKSKVTILSLLSIIMFLVILISFLFPITKPVVINDTTGQYFGVTEGEEKTYDIEIKSAEISGFLFYSPENLDNLEIEITIYNGKEIIYHNFFNSINRESNKIFLPQNLKDAKSVKLTYKVIKMGDYLHFVNNANGNLKIDQVARETSYYPILWEFVIFIGLITALFKNVFKNNNFSEKQNRCIVILYFVLSFILSILSIGVVYKLQYTDTKPYWTFFILLAIVLCLSYIFSYLYNKYNKKIEMLFLIMAVPIAFMYCIFSMPGDVPDECKHFARAYSYTIGNFKSSSAKTIMPSDLNMEYTGFKNINNLFKNMQTKTDYGNEKFENNAAYAYNPAVYAPTIVGISILKPFNININVLWYICKIINTIIFLIFGYFIVKKMPVFKMLTSLTLLMPFCVYEATSTSADSAIIISSFFLISHFLSMHYERRNFKFSDVVIATVFGIVMVIAKPVYLPILIGLMVINLKKNKKTIIYAAIPIIIVGLLYLIWNKLISTEIVNSYSNLVVGKEGIYYLLFHPIDAFMSIFNFAIEKGDMILLHYVGNQYLWSEVQLPAYYPSLYLMLILLSIIFRNDSTNLNKYLKRTFFISAIIASLLVIVAMYIIEYRSNLLTNAIWGVQGRYFFPITILLLMTINKVDAKEEVVNKIYSIIVKLFFLIQSLYLIQLIETAIY